MNTNETLDGVTAGFIATIANSLFREIGIQRMKDLIDCPAEMRLLLMPLITDEHINLLPTITNRIWGRTINYVAFSLRTATSSNPPTMRRVMVEAFERKFALLNSGTENLCNSMNFTFRNHKVVARFPFLRRGELRMYVSGEEGSLKSHVVELDRIDESLLGMPIFFKVGEDDRSDCFKC